MSIVVITGTSTGIGLEAALLFAEQGHAVYATMRNLDRSELLRKGAADKGVAPTILQLDVDDDSSVQRALDEVVAKEGRIDVLVNNAGIAELATLEQGGVALFQRTFNTNVFGTIRCIEAVLPMMRRQGGGTIVNVVSAAGRVAAACQGAYAGSKHALEAASEALAMEVSPHNIRVAIIEPGFFVTPILEKATSALELDASSPYADIERRMHFLYSQAIQTGGHPRVVAEAIANAVTTDQPKLRYRVGMDADIFMNGRARLSDEEWVDWGRQMPEEEFWALFAKYFPMPEAVAAAQ